LIQLLSLEHQLTYGHFLFYTMQYTGSMGEPDYVVITVN